MNLKQRGEGGAKSLIFLISFHYPVVKTTVLSACLIWTQARCGWREVRATRLTKNTVKMSSGLQLTACCVPACVKKNPAVQKIYPFVCNCMFSRRVCFFGVFFLLRLAFPNTVGFCANPDLWAHTGAQLADSRRWRLGDLLPNVCFAVYE